jgi:hypothetical protein
LGGVPDGEGGVLGSGVLSGFHLSSEWLLFGSCYR